MAITVASLLTLFLLTPSLSVDESGLPKFSFSCSWKLRNQWERFVRTGSV
ncbi:BnaCnng36300D [Brassica napus]|uniref:BnaCnng36300D protein n=1 Tax=Brassica napus TaxID=3708 RepID=A0A078J3F5_BRANA|nr:BnaCnng36300D [Brassica napus]